MTYAEVWAVAASLYPDETWYLTITGDRRIRRLTNEVLVTLVWTFSRLRADGDDLKAHDGATLAAMIRDSKRAPGDPMSVGACEVPS